MVLMVSKLIIKFVIKTVRICIVRVVRYSRYAIVDQSKARILLLYCFLYIADIIGQNKLHITLGKD